MRIDFHVHTSYSCDSIIQPSELIKKSKRLGVIPAITDHNTMECHAHMHKLGAQFIPGEEIMTDRGDLIGLYLNESIPKQTTFPEALDQIHGQGGISYLPHMFDKFRHGILPGEKETRKIDIIESFNARCLSSSNNDRADQFADSRNILKAAGSDSHFLFEFGSTYNELPDFDIENPKELLASLKQAKQITKKAPFYVHGTTAFVNLIKKLR